MIQEYILIYLIGILFNIIILNILMQASWIYFKDKIPYNTFPEFYKGVHNKLINFSLLSWVLILIFIIFGIIVILKK